MLLLELLIQCVAFYVVTLFKPLYPNGIECINNRRSGFLIRFIIREDRRASIDSRRQQLEQLRRTHVHSLAYHSVTCGRNSRINMVTDSASTVQNSCGPLPNSHRFRLIFETWTKAIHHCHNSTRRPRCIQTNRLPSGPILRIL